MPIGVLSSYKYTDVIFGFPKFNKHVLNNEMPQPYRAKSVIIRLKP